MPNPKVKICRFCFNVEGDSSPSTHPTHAHHLVDHLHCETCCYFPLGDAMAGLPIQACPIKNSKSTDGTGHLWRWDDDCTHELSEESLPTDTDIKDLLHSGDMQDVLSLVSSANTDRRSRAHEMIAEQMADVAGKRGEDRRIFVEGYKNMLESAMRSLNPPATYTKPPDPFHPSPFFIREADGCLTSTDLGTILSRSYRHSIDLSTFHSEWTDRADDGTTFLDSQETRAMLLYLRDLLTWSTSNTGPCNLHVKEIQDILSHPKVLAFLESE